MEDKSSRKRKFEQEESQNYSGYIQAISPVKTSKRNFKYFNGIFQCQKDEYKEMVIFNDKVHTSFLHAEKQRSPVKLLNCTVLPNRINQSQMDLRFGSGSKLTYMDRLDFQFRNMKDQVSTDVKPAKDQTIQEIMSLQLNTKINIAAKVSCVLQEKECLLYGDMKQMKKVLICDMTGCMPLVLWETLRDFATVGHSMYFKDVVIKEYGMERYLSTTSTTEVKEVEEVQCTVELSQVLPATTGTVETVQIQKTHMCSNCHVAIQCLPASTTYKCLSCNMRQKTKNIATRVTSKFALKCSQSGKLQNLTAEGSCLTNFIDELKCPNDTDDIEEAMLSCDEIRVTYQNKQVINMELAA